MIVYKHEYEIGPWIKTKNALEGCRSPKYGKVRKRPHSFKWGDNSTRDRNSFRYSHGLPPMLGRFFTVDWINVLSFLHTHSLLQAIMVSRTVYVMGKREIVHRLSNIQLLDGNTNMMSMLQREEGCVALGDLWIFRLFDADYHNDAWTTHDLLVGLERSNKKEEVIRILEQLSQYDSLDITRKELQEQCKIPKDYFDQIDRKIWRVDIQPHLGTVFKSVAFRNNKRSKIGKHQVTQSWKVGGKKVSKMKDKKIMDCAWDGHTGEMLFTCDAKGMGQVWQFSGFPLNEVSITCSHGTAHVLQTKI